MKGRLGGVTKLTFRILKDGSVADVTVAQSSGDSELDAFAAACAATWHYQPARLDGHPVEAPWHAQVDWRPNG
jgi:TonB family protein